jgi:molybdenum cofactor guanylyltransferase
MAAGAEPIGVVLAGGSGRRIGGAKATVELHGRPLIHYPLAALGSALGEVVVIAKSGTELPSLPGVTVWIEPDTPQHPLRGIVHALALAGGRPVFVCAVDLPFVTPELVDRIARAKRGGAPAVVAQGGGQMQPLLGCYQPEVSDLLSPAYELPLIETVAALGPALVEVEDASALFNINSPDDLLQAAAMLDARGTRGARRGAYPNVKS